MNMQMFFVQFAVARPVLGDRFHDSRFFQRLSRYREWLLIQWNMSSDIRATNRRSPMCRARDGITITGYQMSDVLGTSL